MEAPSVIFRPYTTRANRFHIKHPTQAGRFLCPGETYDPKVGLSELEISKIEWANLLQGQWIDGRYDPPTLCPQCKAAWKSLLPA